MSDHQDDQSDGPLERADQGPSGPSERADQGPSGPSERADEGVEHLQSAAQEMIKAARAFLDVAEDMIRDPKAADTILGLIDSAVGAAGRARTRTKGDAGDDDDPVEHITVD